MVGTRAVSSDCGRYKACGVKIGYIDCLCSTIYYLFQLEEKDWKQREGVAGLQKEEIFAI